MSFLDTLMKQRRAPAASGEPSPVPTRPSSLGEAYARLQSGPANAGGEDGESESTGGGSRGPARQYQQHDSIKGTAGTMGLAGAAGGSPDQAPDGHDDPFSAPYDPEKDPLLPKPSVRPEQAGPGIPGSLAEALGRKKEPARPSPFDALDAPDAQEPSPDLHPGTPGRRRPRM